MKPIVGNMYFVNHSNCERVYWLVATYLALLLKYTGAKDAGAVLTCNLRSKWGSQKPK